VASETIFAYVGQKGSGKTHEGTIRVLEAVQAGRSVVAIIPDLRLDRLAKLAGKKLEDIERWVRVADPDDMLKPEFWPGHGNEAALRAGSDQFDPNAWKMGILRSGDLLVADECWRLLESDTGMEPIEKKAKKRFKVYMHMARHWRGPLDWSDPENVKKYLDTDWHPGLGGPENVGGDGTKLVSSNLLLLTQKYHDLDRKMIGQVDQVTDLYSFPPKQFPEWMTKLPVIGKAFNTEGKYNAVTFNGDKLPPRDSPAYQKDHKSWRVHRHRPEIHHVIEKEGGQALEVPIDDRRKLGDSREAKHLKFWAPILIIGLVFAAWSFYRAYNKYMVPKPKEEIESVETVPSVDQTQSSPGAVPSGSSAPAPRPTYASAGRRTLGAIGGVAVVSGPDGLTFSNKFLNTKSGVVVYDEENGVSIDRYSAPVVDSIRTGDPGPFTVGN